MARVALFARLCKKLGLLATAFERRELIQLQAADASERDEQASVMIENRWRE